MCRSVWTLLRCGPSQRLHSVAHGPDRLALRSAWARVVCGLQPRAALTKLLWRSVCFAVSCEFSIRVSVSPRRAARVWTLRVSVGTGLGVQLMLSLPTPGSGSVSSGSFRPLLSLSDIFAVLNVSEAGILILPYIRKRPGRCHGAGWGAPRWLTCDLAGLRGVGWGWPRPQCPQQAPPARVLSRASPGAAAGGRGGLWPRILLETGTDVPQGCATLET